MSPQALLRALPRALPRALTRALLQATPRERVVPISMQQGVGHDAPPKLGIVDLGADTIAGDERT